MSKLNIKSNLSVIFATSHEAHFVKSLFEQNQAALHYENISLSEWQEILSSEDRDEKHFLICKDDTPVAYMKINGLMNLKEVWISMLFVGNGFKRQGIGTFALKYAERYIEERGFESVKIQTDDDNFAAINCYLKCGYKIYEQKNKIKFSKPL